MSPLPYYTLSNAPRLAGIAPHPIDSQRVAADARTRFSPSAAPLPPFFLADMIQETKTTLDSAAVLQAAKKFFTRRNPLYSAFIEKEGPTYVTFRGQGGEELVIGVAPAERESGGTLVRGSTYLFDQQIARFFTTLPPVPVSFETVVQ